MSQNFNSSYSRLLKLKTVSLWLLAVVAVFIAAFPKLYEIKTKAGIDISPKHHAGTFFEKHTRGLFKCEWLYPYHCDDRSPG
ncbi:hypothetical protein WKK05_07545 [Nostoc sp. UHCC 0302]|uniref:hypothetical protein n=1 Tax=Nostoc sp. UHCC 0302 TaxID=3134896 RepID=UPI00311CA849